MKHLPCTSTAPFSEYQFWLDNPRPQIGVFFCPPRFRSIWSFRWGQFSNQQPCGLCGALATETCDAAGHR